MAPFYGWDSTASRLDPLRGGSLLYNTKTQEIPGTHMGTFWKTKDLSFAILREPTFHVLVCESSPPKKT